MTQASRSAGFTCSRRSSSLVMAGILASLLAVSACAASTPMVADTPSGSTVTASPTLEPHPTTTAELVSVSLRAGSLPIGGLNGASETWFVASGGTGGPYTFACRDELPPGMALDPDTGHLSGTPTVLGKWTITITATDVTTPADTGSLTVEYGVYVTEPATGQSSAP
jgi:hypothetical protein